MSRELDMDLSELRQELAEALAEGGTQPLIRLTDEELAVLDPVPPEQSIVSTPHLSSMREEEREWALATALRSLVSREVVEITNIEELDAFITGTTPRAHVDMQIRAEVDLALTLRRTADRALAVRQETGRGTAFAYIYIHASDLLLVERVTAGGLHLFTLAATVDDAARMVQALIDPFGIADKDGTACSLDPTALDRDHVGPLAQIIDDCRVVGHFVLLGDAPGPMVMTYATDTAVWTVVVEEPHAPTGIQAQPVSAATLTRRISALLT